MPRLNALHAWVNETHPAPVAALTPASADASFRRYFRLTRGSDTLIVMDAPPDKEDCHPFVAVARLFAEAGVHVPQVLRADFEQGFLLLTDLGRTTYLEALSAVDADPAVVQHLYRDALSALVTLQRASRPGVLPEYDEALLRREVGLFPKWYVARHLGATLSPSEQQAIQRAWLPSSPTISPSPGYSCTATTIRATSWSARPTRASWIFRMRCMGPSPMTPCRC